MDAIDGIYTLCPKENVDYETRKVIASKNAILTGLRKIAHTQWHACCIRIQYTAYIMDTCM